MLGEIYCKCRNIIYGVCMRVSCIMEDVGKGMQR